ncbi:Na+/H+ antiporter NhaA like protein, partial [Aduncisulcus paluster]
MDYRSGDALFRVYACAEPNRRAPSASLPVFGSLMWLAFLKSGVHATVAGVLAAMTIPASTRICCTDFLVPMRNHLMEYEMGGDKNRVTLSNKQMLSALG